MSGQVHFIANLNTYIELLASICKSKMLFMHAHTLTLIQNVIKIAVPSLSLLQWMTGSNHEISKKCFRIKKTPAMDVGAIRCHFNNFILAKLSARLCPLF